MKPRQKKVRKTSIAPTDIKTLFINIKTLFIIQQETGYHETLHDAFMDGAWRTAISLYPHSTIDVDPMLFNDFLNLYLAR